MHAPRSSTKTFRRARKKTWAISDHFDGKRFFNPTHPSRAPGPRTVFKMLREPGSRWPVSVENAGIHRLHEPRDHADVAVTFVNHATFVIQWAGKTILTDPVWSDCAGPFGRFGPKRVRAPGVAFAHLPAIDLVLLTHNHYDHLDRPTLRRLRKAFSPKLLCAAGDARLLAPLGFRDARELDWWDDVTFGEAMRITFVPAQHFSARTPFDRQRSLWGGYMIERGGKRLYFGGDTGYSSHFGDIRARLGVPDLAILGIGAYEPRWFMRAVHMNPADAVRAHQDLGARQSIGMHFGTFKLTKEAIDQPKIDLAAALAEHRISTDEFMTLHEGETCVFRF